MEEKLLPWRWAILIGMTILLVALQFSFIIPGGAAALVFMEYGCTPMQFSMIMSIPYFSGVLFCFAGGTLADRLGLGKVFAFCFAIAALGALGRAMSHSYWGVFISSFFMGMGVAALNANSAKLLRTWFPGDSNSFAMGVYTAGMSGGAAIAIFVGSHMTNIYTCWWLSFGLIVVGLIAWFTLYRKHPNEAIIGADENAGLGEVIKNRYVWGVAIAAFVVFGMTNINGSYMTAAVTTLMGDPTNLEFAATAGNMSTLNTVIACIASMALPVVFAKAFKTMRIPAAICLLVPAVCFALVYFLPYGPMTWALYCIQPLFMASVMPFVKMLPTLIPGVKPEHLGAVGGIQATLQNFGMFLIASYVVSPIAQMTAGAVDGIAYYQQVYLLTGIVCVIGFATFFLFPNVPSSVGRMLEAQKEEAAA